jgi:hypothetical protein
MASRKKPNESGINEPRLLPEIIFAIAIDLHTH